jgi:hypothetical protein
MMLVQVQGRGRAGMMGQVKVPQSRRVVFEWANLVSNRSFDEWGFFGLLEVLLAILC